MTIATRCRRRCSRRRSIHSRPPRGRLLRLSGNAAVFDGRRRYDLVLSDLGETTTPPSRHTPRRARAALPRVIQPLAGFWRSEPRHDERPTQVDYWIASPRPDVIAVPVYLELSAPRGTLAVH